MVNCRHCDKEISPKAKVCTECGNYQSRLPSILLLLGKLAGGITLLGALLTYIVKTTTVLIEKYPKEAVLEVKKLHDGTGYLFYNKGNIDLYVDEIYWEAAVFFKKKIEEDKELEFKDEKSWTYPVRKKIVPGEYLPYLPPVNRDKAFLISELSEPVYDNWVFKKNDTDKIYFRVQDEASYTNWEGSKDLFYDSKGFAEIRYYNTHTGVKESIRKKVKCSVWGTFFSNKWSVDSLFSKN